MVDPEPGPKPGVEPGVKHGSGFLGRQIGGSRPGSSPDLVLGQDSNLGALTFYSFILNIKEWQNISLTR